MVKLIVNSLDVGVRGIDAGSQTENAIKAATYYMQPGYERDPRFVYGKWDGKVHLYNTDPRKVGLYDATFPTGLLDRVCEVLRRLGVGYEVISEVKSWERDPELVYFQDNGPISVRPYQARAVAAWLGGKRPRLGGIFQAGTGGGKTRTAARVTQQMQVRTVFLVNQVDLMDQTIAEFEEHFGFKIGRVGDGEMDIRDITVCTIQTIALANGFSETKRAKELDPAKAAAIRAMMLDAGLVIVDECHGVAAATARAAVALAKNAVSVIGLSASPWRDDGMEILIEATCGEVVFAISASELIEMGWLIRPDIIVHGLPDAKPGRYRGGDINKLYRAWYVEDDLRNRLIADIATEHMLAGDVVLVLVKQIPHGERLQEMIPYSLFMQGKMTSTKRKQVVADAKRGDIRCLIATSLADQGLDIPALSCLILAGGGKSSTKALQRIGRVLRKDPMDSTKNRATIHDFEEAFPMYKKHFRARMAIYKQEPAFRVTRRDWTSAQLVAI